jgi:S1-C subfamily serine protease
MMFRLPFVTPVFLSMALAGAGLSIQVAMADEPPPEVLAAESERIAIIAKAKNAVLAIFDPGGQGGGSGVVISPDGFAISNFHVTHACGNAMKCGMADGRVYDAVLVGLDPTGDVAMIKVLGRDDFPYAALGDSDKLHAGDWVCAMGNPFLLATDFQPTVTTGIISGTHRYQFPDGTLLEYADCLQTDASINPGNSGGPLFNKQGEVVGINGRCSFDKRGRVSVDVGYAISINQIKKFLGSLKSGRIVDHATLGARVTSDDQGRVIVSDLLENSDAFRRGLRSDDEIMAFGGREVTTPNGFKNVLGIYPKGWRVPMSFRREGKRYDTLVRLTGVHNKEKLIELTLGRPEDEAPQPGGPAPKDGRRPKGEPAPKGNPPRTRPVPGRAPQPKEPMPDVVKKVFEEKHGYANYYFNKQEQQRVLKLCKWPVESSDDHSRWTLSGKLDSGGAYRLRMDDSDVVLTAPVGDVKWSAKGLFTQSLLPTGSNGMLPALYLWRQMSLDHGKSSSEFYYLGTAPFVGSDKWYDILVAKHDVHDVECWFYVDPANGQLVGMEMFPDDHSDPCEIAFSQYREIDGHFLPGKIEIRAGDDLFATLNVDAFSLEESKPK